MFYCGLHLTISAQKTVCKHKSLLVYLQNILHYVPWGNLSLSAFPDQLNTFSIVLLFPSRKPELQHPLHSNAIVLCSLFVLHQFSCYAVTAPPSLPTSHCFSWEDSLAQHSHLHNPPLYCVAQDRRALQITSISQLPSTDSPTLPVISLPQPVC